MTAITTRNILAEARRILSTGFCHYSLSINQAGDECDPCDPGATHWCMLGAVARARANLRLTEDDETAALDTLRGMFQISRGGAGLGRINDSSTKDEVLRILDTATKNLEV